MNYQNANHVLPKDLLTEVQTYCQGCYLYIPKAASPAPKQKTAYKVELENRDQRIYLKYLEGNTGRQLASIFHLSETSIRRIVAKQKVRYQHMKNTIEQLLPLWGMENSQITQIYPSAWEISHSHVIKVYHNRNQLERNIKITTILADCKIPVAPITPMKTGELYATAQDAYFLMSEKLPGSNLFSLKDKKMAYEMGSAIAKLHLAFLECEKEMIFWDNSLLTEMQGWIQETLNGSNWQDITESEYTKTVYALECIYDRLPRQPIHRDVHFGNFLFQEGLLSGYIDFDLSQKNIRIFDLCYFLAGLLAEETETPLTNAEWIGMIHAVIAGYENINRLSQAEKQAIPCVMESIEILFAAFYISQQDTKHVADASRVFHQIQDCETDIARTLHTTRFL